MDSTSGAVREGAVRGAITRDLTMSPVGSGATKNGSTTEAGQSINNGVHNAGTNTRTKRKLTLDSNDTADPVAVATRVTLAGDALPLQTVLEGVLRLLETVVSSTAMARKSPFLIAGQLEAAAAGLKGILPTSSPVPKDSHYTGYSIPKSPNRQTSATSMDQKNADVPSSTMNVITNDNASDTNRKKGNDADTATSDESKTGSETEQARLRLENIVAGANEAVAECYFMAYVVMKLRTLCVAKVNELNSLYQNTLNLLPPHRLNSLRKHLKTRVVALATLDILTEKQLHERVHTNRPDAKRNSAVFSLGRAFTGSQGSGEVNVATKCAMMLMDIRDWTSLVNQVTTKRIALIKQEISPALNSRTFAFQASIVNDGTPAAPSFSKETLRSAYQKLGDMYYLMGNSWPALEAYTKSHEYATVKEDILDYCFISIRIAFEIKLVMRAPVTIAHLETCPGVNEDPETISRIKSCKALVALYLEDYKSTAAFLQSLAPMDGTWDDDIANLDASSLDDDQNNRKNDMRLRSVMGNDDTSSNDQTEFVKSEMSNNVQTSGNEVDSTTKEEAENSIKSLAVNGGYTARIGPTYGAIMAPSDAGLIGAVCAVATFDRRNLSQFSSKFKNYLSTTEHSAQNLVSGFKEADYRKCWRCLSDLIPIMKFNCYLAPHADKLASLIELRIFENYLKPYSSVFIDNMIDSFGFLDVHDSPSNGTNTSIRRSKYIFDLTSNTSDQIHKTRKEVVYDYIVGSINNYIKSGKLDSFSVDVNRRALLRDPNQSGEQIRKQAHNKMTQLATSTAITYEKLISTLSELNATTPKTAIVKDSGTMKGEDYSVESHENDSQRIRSTWKALQIQKEEMEVEFKAKQVNVKEQTISRDEMARHLGISKNDGDNESFYDDDYGQGDGDDVD